MKNFTNQDTWLLPINKRAAKRCIKAGREGIQVALEMVREQGREDTIGDLLELDDKLDAMRAYMDSTKGPVAYLSCDEMDLVTKRCTAFARLCM